MEAIVFDTETTDSVQPMEIVEAAYIDYFLDSSATDGFRQLYEPTLPISIGAMAAHHIIPEDLNGMPPSASFKLPDGVKYIIGHKVDFDMGAIGLAEDTTYKRICTLAIARKHYPNLPNHTLSALCYHFFSPVTARKMVKEAHSALVDVKNCGFVLDCMIEDIRSKGIEINNMEDLWQESERCRIPDTISFDKHKGTAIADLPYSYKMWILDQADMDKYLKKAVRATL